MKVAMNEVVTKNHLERNVKFLQKIISEQKFSDHLRHCGTIYLPEEMHSVMALQAFFSILALPHSHLPRMRILERQWLR